MYLKASGVGLQFNAASAAGEQTVSGLLNDSTMNRFSSPVRVMRVIVAASTRQGSDNTGRLPRRALGALH